MSQNIDKLKRTQIKPYTLDKKYKVWIRCHLLRSFTDHLVMSYDNPYLAQHCSNVLETPRGLEYIESWVSA